MDSTEYTPPSPETIGHGASHGAAAHVATCAPPPRAPRVAPQREQLAAAFFAEFSKKRYPLAAGYTWEGLCSFQPEESAGWLAVADMAILNLCS